MLAPGALHPRVVIGIEKSGAFRRRRSREARESRGRAGKLRQKPAARGWLGIRIRHGTAPGVGDVKEVNARSTAHGRRAARALVGYATSGGGSPCGQSFSFPGKSGRGL